MKKEIIKIIAEKTLQDKLTIEVMANKIILLVNESMLDKAMECSRNSDIEGFKVASSLLIDM